VINNDIKEGLQNVIVGDERYSNTQVKTTIFLERLKESRNAFLNQFLQPQIKMICQNLGFRKYPTAKFEEADIKDEVQLQRVATRLMELGIITPEQGMDVLDKGVYPKPDELEPAQREYIDKRKQGMYNPIVGGVPMIEDDPGLQNTQPTKEVGRPVGTSDIPQESQSEDLYSRKNLQEAIYESEKFRNEAYTFMRKNTSKSKLNKTQKNMIDELCQSIMIASDKNLWIKKLEECIDDSNNIENLGCLEGVQEIAAKHDLDLYSAALLYHSSKGE
jgi:hypothetical protein